MQIKPTISECKIVQLPKIRHERQGNLSVIQNSIHIPFHVKRIFYLYDIPAGEERGAHSHKECHQFIIAASGSFDVLIDDGRNKKIISLNRPFYGLHIPPLIWAAETNFSSGSICLVLASHKYDENDYIRNYNDYLKIIK